jgi:hypothetical protein
MCEVLIWDVLMFGLNSKLRFASSFQNFKIARLKAEIFQRGGGGSRCYTGLSGLADFAINCWTVHRTAPQHVEKEDIIS